MLPKSNYQVRLVLDTRLWHYLVGRSKISWTFGGPIEVEQQEALKEVIRGEAHHDPFYLGVMQGTVVLAVYEFLSHTVARAIPVHIVHYHFGISENDRLIELIRNELQYLKLIDSYHRYIGGPQVSLGIGIRPEGDFF